MRVYGKNFYLNSLTPVKRKREDKDKREQKKEQEPETVLNDKERLELFLKTLLETSDYKEIQKIVQDYILEQMTVNPKIVTTQLSEVIHRLVLQDPQKIESVLRAIIDNLEVTQTATNKEAVLLSSNFTVLKNVSHAHIDSVIENLAKMSPKELKIVSEALNTISPERANSLLSKIVDSKASRAKISYQNSIGLRPVTAAYTNWKELFRFLNLEDSSEIKALFFLLMFGIEHNEQKASDHEDNRNGRLIHWLSNSEGYRQKKQEKNPDL
jgi:hypothetical protein